MENGAPSIRPTGRERSQLALAGLLYLCLASATIVLTTNSRDVATLWPANAVLLAVLLTSEKPRWAGVLTVGIAANIAANLLTRDSATAPLMYAGANLVEVTLAAALLRRSLGSSAPIEQPRAVAHFIFGAGLIAPGVSGVLGAGTAALVYGQDFSLSYKTWFFSDALGLLIFTPVLMSLFNGEYRQGLAEQSAPQRLRSLGLQLLVALVSWSVFFFTSKPVLFVIFAPVLLVSFQLGRLGTQAAVLLVAVIGAAATVTGQGPIAHLAGGPAQQSLHFQFFLATLLLTSLPISASLNARSSQANMMSERQRILLEEKRKWARRAATDPLTGLLNRAGFAAAAADAKEGRKSSPMWLIAIDIDHFKEINDRFGHQKGDEALVQVAEVLRTTLREDDVLARTGGDEFIALLPARSKAEVAALCSRLVSGVSNISSVSGGPISPLTVSCGAAPADEGMSLDELISIADRTLYSAKAGGRNRALIAA